MKFPSKSKYIYSSIKLFVVYFFFFNKENNIWSPIRVDKLYKYHTTFGFDEVYSNLTR